MHESVQPNPGLDNRSIQIYLELRQLGEQPVSSVARRLGLKRTTMYYVLERLEELGVVRVRMEKGTRLYAAKSITEVLGLIRKQRVVLRKSEERFRERCRDLEVCL